ncbi:MAG: insulinase family protein [Spirochaetales bacterium]|nr:insulinase family protein [Spirochaetales bacterium]
MSDCYDHRGFRTLSVDPLDEYRGRGIRLVHNATGAEVYQVAAEDTENLFGFAFRTPPSDHTGVPHILEHAVLCGSERYPLKDPFLVMLKGSAHTFLNAMTYPDKTVYPASSTVKADFLNLLRVYGDAVFFPQLKEEAFLQEGHRLDFDDEGRLVRAGIVLNEMKGSYSSAESVAGDWTLRSLFPDTPYSWDSGGDPEHIPSLTYEAFRDFHARWYHPSNARIFLYGDHDLDEVLAVLDGEFLSRFERREIQSSIPLQPRWQAPRSLEVPWPAAPGDEDGDKSTISINWMLKETTNPVSTIGAEVLSFILLGHGGAPLQKAIVDSGLGEDLSPVSGLELDLRQMVFSAALRGTQPERREDFEALVEKTLHNVVDEGLPTDLVEGAFRTVEFRAREIRGGSPFGMRLMKRALRGWLHDRPPVESLAFQEPMAKLRAQAQEGYFESQIQELFLENPHRSTVTVYPDSNLQIQREQAERKELDLLHAELKQEGNGALQELSSKLDQLDEFQETPDSPEDLARIPFLSRQELPTEVRKISLNHGMEEDIPWYTHEVFTNGVTYMELAFDASVLDAHLQSWLPLFGRALTDVGLPGLTHDVVARELAMKTGGLGCSLEASPLHPQAGSGLRRSFFVHLKALQHQWTEALEIAMRLLTAADFSDVDRVGDLLLEMRNDYRSAVVPSGHAFAALRASTRLSEAARWEDHWYGISQLQFLQEAAEDQNAFTKASEALIAIQKQLFSRKGVKVLVTADPAVVDTSREAALRAISVLPETPLPVVPEPQLFMHSTQGEGLATASAVSFSALSLPAPILGSSEHALAGLLAHILRTGYLWENIRMKGGAYGASASCSGLEGVFTFSTYRDPVIAPSLSVFKNALEWASTALDDATVNQAVIGAIGKELRPLGPEEQGFVAFKRVLYGIDDAMRQARRDAQLAADAAGIRRVAAQLLSEWEQRSISVIAGSDALDEAQLPELNESRISLPS